MNLAQVDDMTCTGRWFGPLASLRLDGTEEASLCAISDSSLLFDPKIAISYNLEMINSSGFAWTRQEVVFRSFRHGETKSSASDARGVER